MLKINSLLIITYIRVISIIKAEELSCSEMVKKADEYARHLSLFGDPDIIIPNNEEQLERHCVQMYESVKGLRKYGRNCLPAFPKHALGILTHNLKKVISKRCRHNHERMLFLEQAKCWAPKQKLHRTNLCVEKHVIQLEYTHKQINPEYQIPAICCTFHIRNDCIERELLEICDQQNVDYVMKLITESTKDLSNFACGKYTSTGACDRHFEPLVWQPLQQIVDTDNERLLASRHQHKSTLAAIIAIVTEYEM